MALPKDFPKSPYTILNPNKRWYPDQKTLTKEFNLIPPLVHKIRLKVKEWRDGGYNGVSDTTRLLLNFWFNETHWIQKADGSLYKFKYYFAQREAVETIIYLHEVIKVKDKYDLLKYDSSGLISEKNFDEDWSRFVIKMATGSGKTKVLSLIIVWSFFNKTYEDKSDLSRNFLVITPNIIVLDRILSDFKGLKIFFKDPMIPENGYYGYNWKSDFQLKLHVQDNVHMTNETGNIFLTNIHRVYDSQYKEPSFEDDNTMNYFLGEKAKENHVDLGDIVRDIGELLVLNDEAHHIHDNKLQWFESIKDIQNNLRQKGTKLALQVDFTATPKNTKGFIFPQTVVDYPLVEAIHQNIVKQPFIPDKESRRKMKERESVKIEEKYKDYIEVGYQEWKKSYDEHIKVGKKSVLFIMVEDTKKCDDLASYLERTYPEFRNSVLTIHTKANGDFKDSKNAKEELEILREAANNIDDINNPYKCIVSVLVLKEGWDVKNVTTIVGLRTFSSKSKILPEQTLGRGLRKMYFKEEEQLMIVGTNAFMDFVESIKNEGVELGECSMGNPNEPAKAMVIEVDIDNPNKNINNLNIRIPLLEPSFYKDFQILENMDVSKFDAKSFKLKDFSNEEKVEIIFKHVITDEIGGKTDLKKRDINDWRSALKFFTEVILNETKLVSGYSTVYSKLKEYISNYLFNEKVDLDNPNVIRNLSEREISTSIIETFVYYINILTTNSIPEPKIRNVISIKDTRPFISKEKACLIPKKSVFNKIIGDSDFELEFAQCLESFDDIISYTKIYLAIQFNIDYQNRKGNIAKYYPDFLVKKSEKEIYIIETKGNADLNVPLKLKRLQEWCKDINNQQSIKFIPVYIEQEKFEKHQNYISFEELISVFKDDINYITNLGV